jgi:hypothetical protein
MKTYISQPKGSNSCGAYSIAYYLWETNKAEYINDRTFVTNMHKKIQIGSNNIGMPETYSNPEKMCNELSNSWHSYAYTCMLPNSPLMPIAESFNVATENINVIDKVKSGGNKYAIIICSVGNQPQALHYMLIKYEDGTFKLLDSSSNGNDHVVWNNFILESNGKLIIDGNYDYCYTGAGILVE